MSRAHDIQSTGTTAPRKAGAARCVAVWLTVTALAAAGTHLCVMSALDILDQGSHTSPDAAVLLVAATVGALACPWVWTVTTSTVLAHLRGHDVRSTGLVRRLVLAACGVAVTFTASPVHAHVLDGLPFPDRASNPDVPAPATPPATTRPTVVETQHDTPPGVHEVRPGDSLWSIAASHAGTTDSAAVGALVAALHEANHSVIGTDPDLIHPGQELVLPASTTTAADEVTR